MELVPDVSSMVGKAVDAAASLALLQLIWMVVNAKPKGQDRAD
jgi:hypothetical protein